MHLPHLQLSAAGIVAAAVAIYGVLQAAKRAGLDGYISGRLGVALGVLTAFISTIAISGNISADTLCTALVVALAAAGVHANVKTVRAGSLTAGAAPAAGSGAAAKLALLLLVCALPIGVSGCAARAQVGIPAATQDIELASGLVDSIAHGLQIAQNSLQMLHQAGEVTDAEAAPINAALRTVAQKNDAAIAAVQAAEQSGASSGWQADLQAVAAAAATLQPATLNIASADAKETFTVALATVEAAVAAIAGGN